MTFPGHRNEEHGFISVPSMFGGTKLVPKETSTRSSTKGKSLGQHAAGRMAFTNQQIDLLEQAFHHSQYPNSHLKMSLAQQLDHPVSRVQVKILKSFKSLTKVFLSLRIGSETGELRRACWIAGW